MTKYVHLGADISVPENEIVGFFDADKTTVTETAREFLRKAQKSGRVYYVSLDLPRSFVVSDERVYITNVTCETLSARGGTPPL